MQHISDFWKKNKEISILVAAFLGLKLSLLFFGFYRNLWWDSAVYIGMGKFIYSYGKAGLWEISRPLIWPVILGFFWKIGLDPVLVGRILEIIVSSLCVFLTYSLGKKIFSRKTGILAAVFLALSPTFFLFAGILLTEIISTFFMLLGIYLFLKNKYIASGALFGIAFLARFLQLFGIMGFIFAIYFFERKNKKLAKMLVGFTIPVLLYLAFNLIMYKGPLFPFLEQFYLSSKSGWANYHKISYYFIELFRENFLYFLSIPGFILALKEKDRNKKLIAVLFIVFFIFFNILRQKEMRFLVVLMPYMYLLASFFIFRILGKNQLKHAAYAIIVLSFLTSLTTTYGYFENQSKIKNQYAEFQDEIKKISPGSKIWISSPIMLEFTDIKPSKLIYYPEFDKNKANELISEYKDADYIFLDSCDIGCSPYEEGCEANKAKLIELFKKNLNTIHESSEFGCGQFAFKK